MVAARVDAVAGRRRRRRARPRYRPTTARFSTGSNPYSFNYLYIFFLKWQLQLLCLFGNLMLRKKIVFIFLLMYSVFG